MFIKSQRTWDGISILVLTVSIWIPAIRLRGTGWAPNLEQVELLGLLGVLLGLWLGISSFKRHWADFFFLVFSLVIPGWLLLSHLEPAGDWFTRLDHLLSRLGVALTQVFSGLPVQDSVLFVVFCSLSLWLLGYLAAFGFTRNASPWLGLLPAAAIFGLIDFYDTTSDSQGWSGAILIFCLLLLAARLYWIRAIRVWKNDGFLIERDAGDSVMRITIFSLVVLILFAWNIKGIIRSFSPGTVENVKVSQVWRQVQKQLENAFVALKPGTSLTGSYAEGMRLGSQTPTSLTPAFQVLSDSFSPTTPQMYWRVRVYDTYKNGMWISSPVTAEGSRFLSQDYLKEGLSFSEFGMSIAWREADGTIVPYPGRIAGADLAYNLKYFEGDAVLPGDGLLFADNPPKNGDEFHIRSQVFSGTAQDLQKISAEIPGWMKSRYLQIPESLPIRVRDLSKEIATGETVFDRVEVVTDYLRNHYVYRGQIPDVPSGRDPVDWFLFDQKTGFCNYFASAEVLLLRSAGIPARLAVGYSQGESITGGFQVRLNNGHAWPEVYFADYGWIPFEPTVTLPPTTYGFKPGNNAEDLALQLSQDERHPVDEMGVPIPDLENNLSNKNSQFFSSERNAGVFFTSVLMVLSLYLYRTTRRNFMKISFPKRLERWFEIRKYVAPGWVQTWAWYDSLSDPARQYFRLERLAYALKIIDHSTLVPSELLNKLRMRFPDQVDSIEKFQAGLYSEIYSKDRLYDQHNCKSAGAALQRALIKSYFLKFLKIRP
jgi:transglutaminase-like putative cysteine protease